MSFLTMASAACQFRSEGIIIYNRSVTALLQTYIS